MLKVPREVVAEVIAATDIVDLIGQYIELKPAGSRRYKGLSPFSAEKDPSFTVSTDRQMFHCFSTGIGGDAIKFLMEQEGLSFPEALQKLADRAGVRLPALREGDDKKDYLRRQLLDFGKFSGKFYRSLLLDPMKGSAGRQYMATRRLKESTVEQFSLGYVPEGWQALRDAAQKKGFSNTVMEASGMFRRGDRGDWYDFFRNRLVIPIHNVTGDVVAFGGRDLGDSPAKYINSPETLVYKKSRVLYGLNEARNAMRKTKEAILVEGYFDLLRCFDAGIENVVATCGTALTSEQARLIHRYVPKVTVLYDGDPAGIKAALKGLGILMAAGLEVRAMVLPDAQDPDDFILAEGAETFLKLLADAPDFIRFYIENSAERMKSIEGRTEVASELYDLLRGNESQLSESRLDAYLKHIAHELDITDHMSRAEYGRLRHEEKARPARISREKPEHTSRPQAPKDDCQFVALLLQEPDKIKRIIERMDVEELPEGPLRDVLVLLSENDAPPSVHALEREEAQGLYTAASNTEISSNEIEEKLFEKQLNRLEKNMLEAKIANVQARMAEAKRTGETSLQTELFAEQWQLSQRKEKLTL